MADSEPSDVVDSPFYHVKIEPIETDIEIEQNENQVPSTFWSVEVKNDDGVCNLVVESVVEEPESKDYFLHSEIEIKEENLESLAIPSGEIKTEKLSSEDNRKNLTKRMVPQIDLDPLSLTAETVTTPLQLFPLACQDEKKKTMESCTDQVSKESVELKDEEANRNLKLYWTDKSGLIDTSGSMFNSCESSSISHVSLDELHLKCEECKISFKSELKLKMHLKIFHPNPKLTLESYDVKKSNYTDVQQPAKKFFVCLTCDQYFLYKYMLEAHKKRMHTKNQENGDCKENVNLKKAESNKTSKEEIWFEMGQTEKEPYYCRICEKSYTSRNYFLLHKRIHLEQEQHVCDTCGMAFSLRKRLIRHQRVHLNTKPYKCDICHKDFTSAGALKKHGLSHLREKPFVCKICNRGFSQKVTLDFHASQHPGYTMPYLCYVCGESFYWLSLLLKHEFKVHGVNHGENGRSSSSGSLPHLDDSNMNVFVCDICNQCFKRRNSLLKHHAKFHLKKPSIVLKMHQNVRIDSSPSEKPLLSFCTQCNKGFTCESDLKTHEIIHTDQCPFVCKFCDKGFKFKSSLISHERIHTFHRPFICKVCGKDFTQKTALTIHERVHTGHRPYICTFCGDGFKQINSLNNHVQVMHVRTPFICDTCGKLFYSRTNIKRHVQIHLEEHRKTSKRK